MKISFLSEQEEKKKLQPYTLAVSMGRAVPLGDVLSGASSGFDLPTGAGRAVTCSEDTCLLQRGQKAPSGLGFLGSSLKQPPEAGADTRTQARSCYASPEGFPLLHTRTRDITKSIL